MLYFTSRFRAIQYRLPSWSDRNFRNVYYAALAPRIRAQFVSAGKAPSPTLDGVISDAETFDRAYWANYKLDKPAKSAENKKTSSSDKKRRMDELAARKTKKPR